MSDVTRRTILQILGAGALVGCGGADDEPATPADGTPSAPVDPAVDGGPAADAQAAAPTALDMLREIEAVVVVMMENRSFDHFFGALQRDAKYASKATVAGTKGTETNPAPSGAAVKTYKAGTYTLASPPHSFAACHAQLDGGKNDKFVIEHAGKNQNEVMAWYDRGQIPFYYWLADNFTVCDHWYASVLGPTWPNRFYLHAGTSSGKKDNTPILSGAPETIWDQLKKAGKTAKNYHAGKSGFFSSAFPTKIKAGINPMKKMDEFFADAKAGKLPSVSYIDPDYSVSDDHPAHDIRLGQTFVASIYKALTASPQWGKCLLVITYDEHGGFWDHVAPPAAPDDDPEFKHFGFRVPAIVVGPTVKKGYVSSKPYDHTSVLATLKERFGLDDLTTRSAKANDLTDVFDLAKHGKPSAPPASPPMIMMDAAALATIGENSQEEIEAAIAAGEVPDSAVDLRSDEDRIASWLRAAEELGAVRVAR
ncbi:MAG: Acid phosphatase [Labilithrix sp.]|nr:Acid phosphatase [Labilithrix sp.]